MNDLNDHELVISKLLTIRLTKFQYGFVLGLQGHIPTPEQADILRRIVSRYSNVWNYINEPNERTENEPKKNGALRYECAAYSQH
jgi:hemerythrin-like domain-containing protein